MRPPARGWDASDVATSCKRALWFWRPGGWTCRLRRFTTGDRLAIGSVGHTTPYLRIRPRPWVVPSAPNLIVGGGKVKPCPHNGRGPGTSRALANTRLLERLHHPRHVGHATARSAGAFLLRHLGHDGLGGEDVLGDRRGVLKRRAGDHRRVD